MGVGAVNVHAMDAEDIFSGRPADPLKLVAQQDLDPYSVTELEARITALEAEISRVRNKLEAAVNHRSTADGIFRR